MASHYQKLLHLLLGMTLVFLAVPGAQAAESLPTVELVEFSQVDAGIGKPYVVPADNQADETGNAPEGQLNPEISATTGILDLSNLKLRPSASVFTNFIQQNPLLRTLQRNSFVQSLSDGLAPGDNKSQKEPLLACARADAIEKSLLGFRSNSVLTRGQMAAKLYLAWCDEVSIKTTTVSSFSDVRSGTDMARMTSMLRTIGVLRGNGDSMFHESETARVGEAFALVLRRMNIQTADELSALQTTPWYAPFQIYAEKKDWTFIDKDFGGELRLGDLDRMLEVMGG